VLALHGGSPGSIPSSMKKEMSHKDWAFSAFIQRHLGPHFSMAPNDLYYFTHCPLTPASLILLSPLVAPKEGQGALWLASSLNRNLKYVRGLFRFFLLFICSAWDGTQCLNARQVPYHLVTFPALLSLLLNSISEAR
jgi:hypothetical protein